LIAKIVLKNSKEFTMKKKRNRAFQRWKKISKYFVICLFFGMPIHLPSNSIVSCNALGPKIRIRGGGTFSDWNLQRIQQLIVDNEKKFAAQKQIIQEKQRNNESIEKDVRILKEIKSDLLSLKKKVHASENTL